ncbi:cysteine hydrolase family protein [Calothrix sp. PCC 7507]|uniref:cysteine hydrolase family protein n=1 Tax=Calothrix sp. PCC 7507 TaxID=99598 RepID=UPI00029F0B24|nr:cysteine hydrolase family protein [Calothrix sp. PCC 7507]AFY34931.1 isochorismatase hydrolase [Calothrix sp. PCC 7507]
MKRALLVIDVQNEYFTGKLPITYPPGNLDNIFQVMNIAREQGIPIIVVRHTQPQADSPIFCKGSKEWELHPEIAKYPYDLLIEKNVPGSFTGTELETWLRNRGIDTVVISGYMTQMCCDTTARQASHLGFSVEFLADATGTLTFKNNAGVATDEELHRATLVAQDTFISKVINTAEWINSVENSERSHLLSAFAS